MSVIAESSIDISVVDTKTGQDLASNAQETATAAAKDASDAKTTADSAESTANAASETAMSAQTAASNAQETAIAAAKTATNYIADITDGIQITGVTDEGETTGYVKITDKVEVGSEKAHIELEDTGLSVYDRDGNVVSSFDKRVLLGDATNGVVVSNGFLDVVADGTNVVSMRRSGAEVYTAEYTYYKAVRDTGPVAKGGKDTTLYYLLEPGVDYTYVTGMTCAGDDIDFEFSDEEHGFTVRAASSQQEQYSPLYNPLIVTIDMTATGEYVLYAKGNARVDGTAKVNTLEVGYPENLFTIENAVVHKSGVNISAGGYDEITLSYTSDDAYRYPLGIIGVRCGTRYYDIPRFYLTNRGAGTCTINCLVVNWHTTAHAAEVSVDILWVVNCRNQ